MKKYWFPAVILAVFETVAVTLTLTKHNLFYLFNFSYIGISLALGLVLFIRQYKHARRVTQLLVGLYMLVYLGLIDRENMQIEGFWYYLFTGVFEAAMVLDFLPYKVPHQPRKKIGWLRYVFFAASLAFVGGLFLLQVPDKENVMFWAFIVGNLLYYALGVGLAFLFQDDRAFCKYLCPVTVFLKPMSYFSLIRVQCDHSKCVSCGKCKKVCPMDVDMTDNSRKRKNGTECILCFECAKACPKKAL